MSYYTYILRVSHRPDRVSGLLYSLRTPDGKINQQYATPESLLMALERELEQIQSPSPFHALYRQGDRLSDLIQRFVRRPFGGTRDAAPITKAAFETTLVV